MTAMTGLRVLAVVAAVLATAGTALAAGSGILPGASGKDPYTVDANKLDYLEKDQKLVYTGDVIATQGQTKVKGSVMTIYLDKAPSGSSDRQVRRIEMKGPVTVVQNGKIGTGDSALYDKTDNKWYLIGHVTLTEGSDVTQGEKIVYDLGASTAVVDAGKQGRVKSVFVPKDSDKKDSDKKDAGDAGSKGKPPAKSRPEATAARP